MTNSG